MQEYTVYNWLKIPAAAPGVPKPRPGAVGNREQNVRELLDHRWRCVLAYLGPHIQHGEIQVVNEGAQILRMSPELRIRVQQSYSIPLEEYSPQRRLDLPSEPPPKTGPQEHAVRPPDERDLWHLRAVGLLARGKRRSGIGSGKGVNIAIIDTGADGRHPEISGKILQALALDSTGADRARQFGDRP